MNDVPTLQMRPSFRPVGGAFFGLFNGRLFLIRIMVPVSLFVALLGWSGI